MYDTIGGGRVGCAMELQRRPKRASIEEAIDVPDDESTGEETTTEETEVGILDLDHRKKLKTNKMAGRTMRVRLARTQSLPEPVISVSPPHRPTVRGGANTRNLGG